MDAILDVCLIVLVCKHVVLVRLVVCQHIGRSDHVSVELDQEQTSYTYACSTMLVFWKSIDSESTEQVYLFVANINEKDIPAQGRK